MGSHIPFGPLPPAAPISFCAKLIFYAVLALVGTRLSENDGVQIFRPPTPHMESLYGGHILFEPRPPQLPYDFCAKINFFCSFGYRRDQTVKK